SRRATRNASPRTLRTPRRCRMTTRIAGRVSRSGSIRTGRSPSCRHSGAPRSGEPGIHTHDRGYGFRAWPFGPSRNDEERVCPIPTGIDPVPHPTHPTLPSFSAVAPASNFPTQTLPYGVFSTKDGLPPRVGVRIANDVLALWELEQDSRLDVGSLGVF